MTKKQKQLAEKVKVELLNITKNKDHEIAHMDADICLCELLEGLGFVEIVEIYKRIWKWYA